MPEQPKAHPEYGIDAPRVVRLFAIMGLAGVVLGPALFFLLGPAYPAFAIMLAHMVFWPGISFLITALWMLWGSKFGKLRLRERMLNGISWRGDEQVLDVGCGKGLLLLGAARRLSTGKAVGIDLWQKEDLAGNSPEATWKNAHAEGLADRVELKDGDARRLPFADETFDVVLSSSTFHNIYDGGERQQAFREVARVLKPGGSLAIFDIRHGAEYQKVLQTCGLSDVQLSRPMFTFLIPGRVVTGRKPPKRST